MMYSEFNLLENNGLINMLNFKNSHEIEQNKTQI